MSVFERIEAELAAMPDNLRESGAAAIALAMAERIDNGKGSPSECAKVALDALARLREQVPPEKEKTGLDALRDGRALRLVGGAAGTD